MKNLRYLCLFGVLLACAPEWTYAGMGDCLANASAPTFEENKPAPCSVDLNGNLRTSGTFSGSISNADGAIVDGASSGIKATVKDYTNSNPLAVQIMDNNGDPASIGGGTEYTEDAAAAANPVGKMGICRRRDTLTAAEVSADGDNIACNATSKGEIYVKQTDAVPVTDNGGSLTVDGTVSISGSVTVTDGAGALNVIVDSSALPTGAAQDSTLTGGTQKAIIRGGAKGSTSATDVTSTASGSNHQPLDVVIYDTSGNAITSFGGSGGTSSNFGSAFPTPGTAAGFTDGTNMVAGRVVTSAPSTSDAGLVVRPISPASSTIGSAVPSVGVQVTGSDGTNARAIATDTSGNVKVAVQSVPSNQSVNIAQMNGVSTTMGNGTSGTGVQRVTIASDSTGQVALAAGSNTIGALTANQSVNVAQMNGVATSMGNGASGTGTQRVTIANDSTGTVTVTQGTGTNLHVVCDSGCSSSAGFADNGAFTFGTTAINPIGGVFDDTSPNTATENSAAIARITQNKALHMNLRNASGTEIGTASNAVRTDPIGTTPQPASQSGTWTVQPGNTANTTPWLTSPIPSTSGGTSVCYITSAASTNATNCKASAGQLYGFDLVNTTATVYYLRLYNLATSPTCSSATGFVRTIPIPAATTGAGIARSIPVGEAYGTGLGFCLTGGGSSTDNTNAATGVYVSLNYK